MTEKTEKDNVTMSKRYEFNIEIGVGFDCVALTQTSNNSENEPVYIPICELEEVISAMREAGKLIVDRSGDDE